MADFFSAAMMAEKNKNQKLKENRDKTPIYSPSDLDPNNLPSDLKLIEDRMAASKDNGKVNGLSSSLLATAAAGAGAISDFGSELGSYLSQQQDDYFNDVYPSSGSYGSAQASSGPTDQEQRAANNLTSLARYNASSLAQQRDDGLANFQFANQQNRAAADLQRRQNSRKTALDRFNAQRDLINSTVGLLGQIGPTGMQSSTTADLMQMLEDRNDRDNTVYWGQHQQNQDTVENAYNEAVNQNNVAANELISNTEKSLRDMQADLAANLNNINPDLFVEPGTGAADLSGEVGSAEKAAVNRAKMSGYLMPDTSAQAARAISGLNMPTGNDYMSRYLRRYNSGNLTN